MPRPTTRPSASRRKLNGSLRALYALASVALLALVVAGLFSVGFRSASAQAALGEPQTLPGDSGTVTAASPQERPQLSRGAESYLSVWTDSRTALAGTLGTSGTGLGNLQDIYAARIAADGRVIDTTPIIVSQEQHEQINPRVGWNGQNWLVSWLTKRPRDQYSHTHDLVAARVSPAGALLDAAPIVIRADVSLDSKPAAVIEDGAGNWIVIFESFLPQEGTSIPRGVLAARISDAGVVLDPGGRLIYNHHNQFMGDSDIARAGDRYLLTFVDVASSHGVMGLLLDASLNPLRNGPEQLGGGGAKPRVASNGETWFVINRATGTLVNRDGDAAGTTAFINPVSVADPVVCWDGQYWIVAFSTNYNAATQTYLNQDDLYVSRVSATGALLDPNGLPVNQGTGHQVNAAIAPGIGGGAQVAWEDLEKQDVGTARVTRAGAVGADGALALGAPRQSRVRTATNGSGFLAVFRSDVSNTSRILGQHLNADGTPADAEPFVISNDPSSGNPSVGWDGANYLAVWDQTTASGRQTFGAVVPAVGNTPGAPFFIANGFLPDAAGLNGTFLVVNILQETTQIKTTQGTLVSGAGAPLAAPFKIQRAFNTWPRVAAFAGRWLAVWEYHGNHDGSPGTIYGSFVEPGGTFGAPFIAGNVSSDVTPHLAVAGDQALVVWSTGDIHARRLNADGSSPEPQSGAPVSAAAGLQALPAVAWDGDEYVVTWVDQRNELFPQQPRGDIYGARVAPTNVKFEELPVANSTLPEDSPFVVSAGGLTLFSYSTFNPQPPYAALRVTTRAARFGAPPGVGPSLAPGNLSATQVNSGVGTVTLQWADRTDNEDGFKLEMRSGAGAFNQIKLLPANATTTTVTNLGRNEPYVFRLRAYNAAGDSDYSNEAGAPAVVMTPFTQNTYNEPANVQLAATASDPDGISRVEFLTSSNGTSYSLLATDTDAPYSYQWQDVPRGYYYVQARAYDAVGSHTTSLYESFVVYGKPTAAISSPSDGATFPVGSSVTINATAQAQNADEYVLRMDFYANSTLIGTVQGHYASYQFTWANPPVGNYQLTARPTSSRGLTGSSAPARITVGNPGADIAGRVTDGTNPLYGVMVALSGAQSARAMTDADGNYTFTNLAAGGGYAVTPQASGYTFNPSSLSFNNLAGSQTANFTGTPGAPVPGDPNAAPIYSQASDGRAGEGPSSKTLTGQLVDQEVADDFDLKARITRVRVAGSRGGYNAPPNPDYRGIYVRFYDGSSGTPGAQQAEYFLPKGASGVTFDAARPSVFDVTLPTPFNASGRHFVSVQPVYYGTETWGPSSGGHPNVRGSAWLKRDRLANGSWVVGGVADRLNDMAFDLFGTLQSAPRLDSVSPNPAPRSGLLRITGANFGAAQGSSQLTIDGKQSQYIAHWADNLIVAYVPETSALGDVSVAVTSASGTGSASLNVTTRPADGRIRWRFTVAGDYVPRRSAIGPDGTVYANDVLGRLYALTPDGGLKWVFQAGLIGAMGSVSVGADGTVYVGGLVPKDPSTPCQSNTIVNVEGIFAVNPDGTRKWLFDKTCDSLLSGPDVGPDGNIHAVSESIGIGAFALKPDGTLAHAPHGRFGVDGSSGTEIVFGPAAPGEAPTQKYFQYESGGLFGYTLTGQQVFLYPTNAVGITQPVAGQRTGTVYTTPDQQTVGNLFAVSPRGALRWVSPIRPIHSLSIPDAPPSESAVYIVQDGGKLHRVKPEDGSVVWTFIDNYEQLFHPIASPDDRLVLMGGQIGLGLSGFFEAVSGDGRQLWKQYLPDEPGFAPYGQLRASNRARFTADGRTAYIAADVLGDSRTASNPVYSFFYALDTSDNNVPLNQPPTVTVVSPLPNSNVPKGTQLDFKASVQDDGQISRVEFYYYNNGSHTRVGTDTTPDADGLYGVQFTPPAPGGYSLTAVVYDTGGLRGESQTVSVTVSNQPPTISWVSPANNATFAAPASITLTVRAADSDGQISVVRFYSSQLGELGNDSTPDAGGNYQIEWANPTQATHELTAWAFDNDGTERAASISITVGPVATPTPTPTPTPTVGAPTVSITSPADRASFMPGTTVTITADASDSDGRIARVEFWQDGSGQFGNDLNAPYSAQIRWPSPSILKLYAVAVDDAGNRTQSAPIFVYFEDPAGNLTITGRITHQQSTPANPVYLTNALIKLGFGNHAYRATRTDANGYYTFTGLSYGGRYKIEPAEPGYAFYPPYVTYEGLVSNVTRDFVADGPLQPGPTPTPTPGASALAWERFYNSPHNSSDGGALLAHDGLGNTYVAGTSYAPAGGDTNISLVKYAPDGTQLWQREYAGRGDYKDWATSVRTDSEGNVYVSGTAWGGTAYEYDIVTLKYAPDGTELWARVYNGPLGRWDTSAAMEIDNAGNVLVGGYSQASETSGRLYDEFIVVKYNPAGGVVWERRNSVDRRGDRLVALAVDSARNVYATGDAYVSNADGTMFEDVVTVKYGPDGTKLWASRFNRAASTAQLPQPLPNNPASRARAGGAKLDPATGDLYVFGTSEFGPTGLDYLLLKYNQATGELHWNRNWAGQRTDTAHSVAVDAQGNAYLTGETYDGDFESATGVRSTDVATVKFAPDGATLWERLYRGFPGKTDAGRRIVVDTAGSAYVAFYSEGFFTSDTGVVKYHADGTEQWVYRYDNSAHTSDYVSDLALDAAGNLYVAGSATVPNGAGSETVDLVTFKLAPATSALNIAPDVRTDVQGAPTAGSAVTVNAIATDLDGSVARVDFYDGTAQIGTDAAAPFSVEWSPTATGTHAITALATDDKGASRTSKTQLVTVGDAQPVYAIAGQLTANGSPLAGASVALGGARSAETKTGADGRYAFTNLPTGGNYTVTPSLADHIFAPANRAYSPLAQDVSDANFVGTTASTVTRVNHALTSNGGAATASSHFSDAYWGTYPPGAVIDGSRRVASPGALWLDNTYNSWPDWIEVAFAGPKSVSEIVVVTHPDDTSSEPTDATTFTKYGATSFEVQYWTGAAWATVPGGSVTGNDRVIRKFTFAPVNTSRIRVVVTGGKDNAFARLVEVEAWGEGQSAPPPPAARHNIALASNGGVATASSHFSDAYWGTYPPDAVIDGSRRVASPGALWIDNTYNSWPDSVEVAFAGPKSVSEIVVVTHPDDTSSEPTDETTFTKYGATSFEVQYWTGAAWATVPGGSVTGNDRVIRKFTFAPVNTSRIRVVVTGGVDNAFARLVEVEAY